MNSSFLPVGNILEKKFEQPRMLVDPIIPWGGIFVIHGPRASGKSQLALELASAIAQHREFLDTWTCERARVLFVEVDMTAPILQERLLKLGTRFAPDLPIAFLTAEGGLNVVQPHPTDVQGLRDAQRFTPDLVIVDSLRKTHVLDENESTTPDIVFQAWRRWFPAATLGFLHHDRKVIVGPLAGDVDEAFRGTTAWLDNADTGLHLVRDKKIRDEHRAMLSFSKVRTCEQPRPVPLRLNADTLAVEPASPTPRLLLLAHLEEVPADRFVGGAARWLLEHRLCSKPTAYRIAKELELPTASLDWRSKHDRWPTKEARVTAEGVEPA